MGKSLLTSHQKVLLAEISLYQPIAKRFYFTGGTALSEFYLRHRLSEDIDFFSIGYARNKFDFVVDRKSLAKHFLAILDQDLVEVPKMLKPLDEEDFKKFLLNLAKSLEGEIFK